MASKNQAQSDSLLSTIIYSAGTDVGMRREENQDSYGIMLGENYRLFIVADGMGGVQGGAIASNLAITTIEKSLRDTRECTQDNLVRAIHAANAAIHERGQADSSLTGMGTTIVSLLCAPSGIFTAHVGDSRLYRIRNGSAVRQTEDHTLVGELVRSGAITEEQAEHHPVSHMLTRSLGPSPQIQVDSGLLPEAVQAYDAFLLCSDGLYNMVKEHEIAEIVSKNSTDDAVQILIDLANERGGTDNITVVIINLGGEYPQSLAPKVAEEVEIDEESVIISEPTMVGGYHAAAEVVDVEEAREEVPIDAEDLPSSEEEQIPDAIGNEAEEEQAADVPLQVKAPSRLPLIAGGFLAGLAAAFIVIRTSSVSGPERAPAVEEPKIAESETTYEAVQEEVEQRPQLPGLSTLYATPQSAAIPTTRIEEVLNGPMVQEIAKVGPAERASIVKRKSDLRALIQSLAEKLSKFEQPLSGELAVSLKDATKKAEDIEGKIDRIKADTDVATRKLATWYDRKRRLENTDPINMAGEIATTIASVKVKKEEFERATWDYLKEVEALRYSAGDSSREAHVAELVRIRSEKMKELAAEVRQSVEKGLSDADHGVAELTFQRTILESSLDTVRGDLEFVRTLTGSDTPKLENMKKEFIKRKETAELELRELEKLLPESEER